jgi:hypothetical protein
MIKMRRLFGTFMSVLAAAMSLASTQSVTSAASGNTPVVINEVLASNSNTTKDPQNEYDDWIELYNRGRTPINIGGYYLTDDPAEPRKWRIPTGTGLMASTYLLIWADGDTDDTGFHASFKLSSSGGGVYLFATDGTTLLDSIEYGEQATNTSYGRYPDAADFWGLMPRATPAAANSQPTQGRVADIQFNHSRGFYTAGFNLTLVCATPQAAIYYTLDGREPYDLATGMATGTLYTSPIPISKTTCVRACAIRSDWTASDMTAHTYIFPEDVRYQATNPTTGAQVVPTGYPTSWGTVNGDYQVDPDVVALNGKDKFSGLYARTFADDLKAVPTVSLVMAKDDWFGPTGIYINQSQDGTERACSLEWIDPNGEDSFQINCAIAMQGGVTGGGTSLDRWKIFKLSMRPRFKTALDNGKPTGGPAQLNHRIFPDSPTDIFDTFVLDALLANTWNHSGQHTTPNYLEDQFTCDLHNAMGGQSPHGRYVHVYIDGMYWGMYCLHERPDHSWAAQTFGGDKEEYDVLKHNSSMVVNDGVGGSGAKANYNAMLTAANAVAADPANMTKYNTLSQKLDVDEFITCLLAHWYALNWDWPDKNWYATHSVIDGLWRFHVWDAEHALEYWNTQNVFGLSENGIHDKLKASAEYRMRFADLAHRFFFNGGVLSDPAVANRYRTRIAEIDRAIVGESARWGDTRSATPHTRQEWTVIENGILAQFIQPRSATVLNWLKTNGLYPNVAAPVFSINGAYQHGGHTPANATLSMQAAAGAIWYTLDGTDPRVPGSTVAGDDVTLAAENAFKRVLVPTAATSDAWRGGAAFDDTAWTMGTGGVGYERSSGYQSFFTIDVQTAMYNKNASCYIRIPFTVASADVGKFSALALNVRYDDGFVAYINGTEVARKNCTGAPIWNSKASASNSDISAVDLEPFDLSAYTNKLVSGANILAIQALNESTTSSDFLMSAQLSATKGSGTAGGVTSTALRYSAPLSLTASAIVKARALNGTTWSALNEALYAVGPVAGNLRITEIMYHPIDAGHPDDPNTEFIELTNAGSAKINLSMVLFTKGIDFAFPNLELAPHAYTLVVRDPAAFKARYGDDLPVAGQYTGNLANGGERLQLQDAAGQVIEDFSYDDGWYELTDGKGYSLTVESMALADPSGLNDQSSWRPSAQAGGSPGYDDAALVSEPGATTTGK